jgi:predicted small secreted protein
MKKHLLFVCAIVSFAFFVSSCRMNTLRGEGNKTTLAPTLASFDAIEIEVPLKANITVQSGSQPGLQMNGYENVLKHIKTEVKGTTLHITCDLGDIWTIDCDGMTTQITLPSLKTLTLTGAPDADIHGNITGSDFKLDISGAANVVIDNINVDTFTSDVSGAADITVKGGAVKSAGYEISGAGKVKAFPLQTTETKASISGAGTSEVTATSKLSAGISGAGTIKYKGHPSISQDVSGVGTIKDAN